MSETKKRWEYNGRNPQGFQLSGYVHGDTAEEAMEQAKRYGLNDLKIDDPENKMKPKAMKLEPIGDPGLQPIGDPGMPASPQVIMPKVDYFPEGPPPEFKDLVGKQLNQKARKDQEVDVREMIGGLRENVEAMQNSKNPETRQSLFISEPIKVKEDIEPLLAKHNGRIISVCMQPNHHGIMMVAVVIEHEIPKEQK